MTFLKSVLSTVVGLIIFSILGSLFFVALLSGIMAMGSGDAPEVKANSVLLINLHGQIKERVAEDPFQELLGDSNEKFIPLLKTIEAIEKAKDDENIVGIHLSHGYLSGGSASIHEIRSALVDFKSSGKFIYSYAEYLTEANYYVASVADEIFLNPIGSVEFNGLNANVTFFKGLFDKLDIDFQIFRVGTYKSAVEPFLRKDLSDASKEQLTAIINSLYDNYLKNISESRNIGVEKLKEISDGMLVRKAEDALDFGLITQVGYSTQVIESLKEKIDISESDDIDFYTIENYASGISSDYSSNKVAVIVAEGPIVSGNGEPDNVGSKKFVKAIREARESSRVKAVVIRINSPGGSMMASDVMWNEIMLTKAEKPVIASMSSVAASGGYYMAMPCDTIIAQPMTITGSIGIFGMIPNMGKFLENKLGITSDGVSTGEFSNLYRASSALNDQEKAIIQASTERGYETFTTKAANGRNMDIDDLKAVASGRVWTGDQAKENGLVDILGSYNDAVELAAQLGGIEDDYAVTHYPQLKSKFEEIMEGFSGGARAKILEYQYGEFAEYVDLIKNLENLEGVQARMPYDLEIN
ncbi:MAG: signal peptide peptidase SppA [Reichenbachiella sp.]